MVSLDKIAKRIQNPDTVRLISRDRENLLEIVLNGGIERKFDASLIELNNNLPRINIDFPVSMELDTEVFRNCIKDLAVAGGSVTFDVDDDALVMSSVGELGNAVITIRQGNESLHNINVGRPCSARYNLSYLVSFLKAGQISDTIRLFMGEKEYPLKLEFSFEHGNMVFFLAPMEY
jgi:DNA polymerase III sliding clamp (beta) subunit (PCNA family)